MRHRKRGRHLGRTSSHRRAMLRNLASALILTERDAELDPNPPKVKGRIITTLQKAKEVRPLVEKCVTIARHSLEHEERAEQYATAADRRSPEWNEWRHGARWHEWCQARAPVVAARRRVLQLLGDKQAVSVLFADIAPRFADRAGGYTRILRLAKPRLGDAGTRAILEFVGQHDRVAAVSQRPLFEDTGDEVKPADDEVLEMDPGSETSAPDSADAVDRDAAGTDEARQQGER